VRFLVMRCGLLLFVGGDCGDEDAELGGFRGLEVELGWRFAGEVDVAVVGEVL